MTQTAIDEVFTVARPWGSFAQFLSNAVGTVKVITVAPHQRLSLQRHQMRDELWCILDGPVDVTVGDRTWSAQRDELVWVPRTAVHRMANSGDAEARVLEVGLGTFDEDDIERLQDDYQRPPRP